MHSVWLDRVQTTSLENISTKNLVQTKLFESNLIWEENNRQNLGNVWNINKGKKSTEKSLSTISNFYTSWQFKT